MHVIHRADSTAAGTPASGTVMDVDIDDLYGIERPRPNGRPWVGICMIASLDGSTVVDGRSGALGNATDRRVLGALRRAADVVLVGAGTARAEGYGPPRTAGLRIGVVTSRAEIDPDSPLFASGAGFLVMPEDGPPAPTGQGGPIDVVRAGAGSVDLPTALARLGELMEPPAFVQAEGGAHLNGALLTAGCVDELNLTVSPVLTGGDGLRVTSGAMPRLDRYDLAHLGIDGSYLYGRWVRRNDR